MAWRHRERTEQRGARGVAVARGFSLTGSFVSAPARSWMLAAIPADEPANERRGTPPPRARRDVGLTRDLCKPLYQL